MEEKTCTLCKRKLPATSEHFYKNKMGRHGLASRCKKCIYETKDPATEAERKRKWQEKNKEKVKVSQAQRYSENREYRISMMKERYKANKESASEYAKKHYEQNRESYIERSRKRYEEKRDEILEQCKAYRHKNSERVREYFKKYTNDPENRHKLQVRKAKHKYMIRNLESTLTPDEWRAALIHFENSCCYCGDDSGVLQQDHFIPVVKSGPYSKENIVPACKRCNASKNKYDFKAWYMKQKFYSEYREERIIKYLEQREAIK